MVIYKEDGNETAKPELIRFQWWMRQSLTFTVTQPLHKNISQTHLMSKLSYFWLITPNHPSASFFRQSPDAIVDVCSSMQHIPVPKTTHRYLPNSRFLKIADVYSVHASLVELNNFVLPVVGGQFLLRRSHRSWGSFLPMQQDISERVHVSLCKSQRPSCQSNVGPFCRRGVQKRTL